ncbi:hypothetical protein [Deinococcus sp.]|uniref:hypothetical protein n=1 Tax=Deinococcus sp. TaxID=47478 RepID=UPI003CC5019B
MSVLTALLFALLLSSASAAGLLGSRDSFYNSTFCAEYGCSQPYRSAQSWVYYLKTGDRAFIQRENEDPQGRIALMALFINESAFDADVDRQTFQDLQRAAVGFVAYSGRLETCYGAVKTRELLSYPASNARSVMCFRSDNTAAVALLADLSAPAPVSSVSVSSAPAPLSSASGAPTLIRWYFTGCTSPLGTTSWLPLGQAARCTLQVETAPTGRQVISASFEYELEYRVGAASFKTSIPGRDTYARSGGGNIVFGSAVGTLSFGLPLSVRARTDRRYTAINAIGTLVFDDGSSKRVYEPLLVR